MGACLVYGVSVRARRFHTRERDPLTAKVEVRE